VTTALTVDDKALPKDQLDLIEHFEADYNSIDQFLRKALVSDRQASFSYLVSEYSTAPTPIPPPFHVRLPSSHKSFLARTQAVRTSMKMNQQTRGGRRSDARRHTGPTFSV